MLKDNCSALTRHAAVGESTLTFAVGHGRCGTRTPCDLSEAVCGKRERRRAHGGGLRQRKRPTDGPRELAVPERVPCVRPLSILLSVQHTTIVRLRRDRGFPNFTYAFVL